MEKILGLITLLLVPTLFVIGYNVVFNTYRYLKKICQLSGYKENSFMYNKIMSESNIKWAKVSGVAILFFALILLFVIIHQFIPQKT